VVVCEIVHWIKPSGDSSGDILTRRIDGLEWLRGLCLNSARSTLALPEVRVLGKTRANRAVILAMMEVVADLLKPFCYLSAGSSNVKMEEEGRTDKSV
jgi:hypothetical protein